MLDDTAGNSFSSSRGANDEDPDEGGDPEDALVDVDAGVDDLAACAADLVPGLDLLPLPTDAPAALDPDHLVGVG